MDVLIPLAATSNNNFLELKLALRSLVQCKDVGTVYVITTGNIPWLQNAVVVKIDDPCTNNKDKNLIRKVQLTLQLYPEIQDFVLFTDDYIITKPISLKDLPDVYNSRGLDQVKAYANTKWQRRLLFTLNIMRLLGKDVSCNWDSHTPIRLNRDRILDGLSTIDYLSAGANFTICTLFANLCNKSKSNGVLQEAVKSTCESSVFTVDWDKLLIGYNDAAFNNGLREILVDHFNIKSMYENDRSSYAGPVVLFTSNITNVSNLLDCVRHATRQVIVFPWDDVSENNVKDTGLSVVQRCGLSAHSVLTLAKLMSDYCMLFDGAHTYDVKYIENYVSDVAETTAVIYDPANYKGIVNNTFLTIDDINTVPDVCLTEVIDYLTETIKPSIIIKDEPERL